uniref:Hedgehog protein n=1 Tax=Novocrania anomala TaxID=317945 RepID=A0A0U2IL20_9BILA|nr:hedgehog [Novocrania anomala]
MASGKLSQLIKTLAVVFLVLTETVSPCHGPGRGSGWRRGTRKRTPLVFKQHVPNVSENTLGASGLSEGRILRDSKRFKDLVKNENPNIEFRDEEGDGSDRLMSKRCKDIINSLAISVMNEWPGVKLRVTEAWDDILYHAKDSLHYEGRAVDITTNDKDRTKYGMLARLAVEAGFDWVYYESRGHIHCSVKSDSSAAVKVGGCFDATGHVTMPDGTSKPMSEVQIGDHVLTVNENGQKDYSEVIMFLHRDDEMQGFYYTLHTGDGDAITLTPSHLLYITDSNNTNSINPRAVFAKSAKIGQYLLKSDSQRDLRPKQITKITTSWKQGVYAPLTKHGTLMVDDFVASCYGVISNQNIAHLAFAPARLLYNINSRLYANSATHELSQNGVHWYAELLYRLSYYVVDQRLLFQH